MPDNQSKGQKIKAAINELINWGNKHKNLADDIIPLFWFHLDNALAANQFESARIGKSKSWNKYSQVNLWVDIQEKIIRGASQADAISAIAQEGFCLKEPIREGLYVDRNDKLITSAAAIKKQFLLINKEIINKPHLCSFFTLLAHGRVENISKEKLIKKIMKLDLPKSLKNIQQESHEPIILFRLMKQEAIRLLKKH